MPPGGTGEGLAQRQRNGVAWIGEGSYQSGWPGTTSPRSQGHLVPPATSPSRWDVAAGRPTA